jgi:hypothetical protein
MYSEHAHPGSTVARIVGMTVLGLVGAVIIAFLFGSLVMLLWNWLMPPLLHAGTINYWQAFGLVILAKILFGGSGGGHYGPGHRVWKKRARRWDRWDKGSCGAEDWGDDWAPRGSHRNWRRYDQYWKGEGKAAFEAWLDKQDKAKAQDPDKGSGEPKAE